MFDIRKTKKRLEGYKKAVNNSYFTAINSSYEELGRLTRGNFVPAGTKSNFSLPIRRVSGGLANSLTRQRLNYNVKLIIGVNYWKYLRTYQDKINPLVTEKFQKEFNYEIRKEFSKIK